MSRVVITGGQPKHLSCAEAESWIRTEVAGLRVVPGVESVVLSRVAISPERPRPWAWVCELHLADGADGHECAAHPACTEWIMDLRLLGMRPVLAVLEAGERVH